VIIYFRQMSASLPPCSISVHILAKLLRWHHWYLSSNRGGDWGDHPPKT